MRTRISPRAHAYLLLLLSACGQVNAPATPDAGEPDAPVPPPPTPRDLTVTVDGIDADFVAVRDGDGPLAVVSGAQQTYRTQITAERYGVAVGCRQGVASTVQILQRTVQDGLDVHATCGEKPAIDTVPVTVELRGFGAGLGIVQFGHGAAVTDDEHPTIDLMVPRGFIEPVGAVVDGSLGGFVRVIRLPPFDLQSPASIVFDAQQGSPLDRSFQTAVTLPPATQRATTTTRVHTAAGTFFLREGPFDEGLYPMLPATLRRPGDLYDVTLDVAVGTGPRRDLRSTTVSFATPSPAPLALELPAPMVTETPVLLAAPARHPAFSFTASPGAAFYRLVASTPNRTWTVELSPSFVANGVGVHYEVPDLSQMPAFAVAYALAAGNVDWSVGRVEGSSTPADGRVQRAAFVADVIAP